MKKTMYGLIGIALAAALMAGCGGHTEPAVSAGLESSAALGIASGSTSLDTDTTHMAASTSDVGGGETDASGAVGGPSTNPAVPGKSTDPAKPATTKQPPKVTTTKKPGVTTTSTKKPATTTTRKPAAETYVTINYEGKEYKVKMGRNGNPYLIADKSTLPPQLQPYCYPYDIEGIRRDVTDYAKTKGFTFFGKPTAKFNKQLADSQCSWDNPDGIGYGGDDWFIEHRNTFVEEAWETELDEVIGLREEWAKGGVNSLARRNQDGLCLWFVPYEKEPDPYDPFSAADPKWNGQKITEYVIYWMTGWGSEEIEPYN